jgi:hypothetical protein
MRVPLLVTGALFPPECISLESSRHCGHFPRIQSAILRVLIGANVIGTADDQAGGVTYRA